jgi:hypothetical protein
MSLSFYLFPLLFGLISFLSTFSVFYLILIPKKGFIAKTSPQLISHLHQVDDQLLQNEITPFLEERIEGFLRDLVGQIPMGSMIFNSSLSQSLKRKAHNAILEMVPDLKKRGLEKAQEAALQKQQELWKGVLWKYGGLLSLLSGGIGAVLGVLVWWVVS